MSNTLFYLSQTGLLTRVGGLSIEVASDAFNNKFESKEMLKFLIQHCSGNPRRLQQNIIYDLIKISGKAGVHINDSIDVDKFVLDNFDVIWDAAQNNKSMTARMYFENTKRGYAGLLKSRHGDPVMLLTQEEQPPTLDGVEECKHFGATYTGYYRESLKERRSIFRKIKKICSSFVDAEENAQARSA